MDFQSQGMVKGFPFDNFLQDWELKKPEHWNIKVMNKQNT